MTAEKDIETQTPIFEVGEVIYHKLFGYRGVIMSVDKIFSGSQDWYNAVAKSKPPKDLPWYHVLVEDAADTTYVAQRNLELDGTREGIDHPLVRNLFEQFNGERYIRKLN